MNNVSSFDRTPHSMCGQVSNNEHATSHHLTRLNVEFADLIATCNIWHAYSTNDAPSYDTKVNDLVTLTFMLEITFYTPA